MNVREAVNTGRYRPTTPDWSNTLRLPESGTSGVPQTTYTGRYHHTTLYPRNGTVCPDCPEGGGSGVPHTT